MPTIGASKPTSGRTRKAVRAYKTPRREPAPLAESAPALAGATDPHRVPAEGELLYFTYSIFI
jgi:hypothetical protein